MIGKSLCPIAIVAIYIMASIAPSAHTNPPSPSEYQLKAVFLYNFAKFVKWPAESFADADSPIILGILGVDPFGAAIRPSRARPSRAGNWRLSASRRSRT